MVKSKITVIDLSYQATVHLSRNLIVMSIKSSFCFEIIIRSFRVLLEI